MVWQKSSSFKSTGPSVSTPCDSVGGGGTFTAARTKLLSDGVAPPRVSNMSYRDATVEQANNSFAFNKGGQSHVGRRDRGGPVRPGQLEKWQTFKPVNFYGTNPNWSNQISPITKKHKAEKLPIQADGNRTRQINIMEALKEKIRASNRKIQERGLEVGSETRSGKMLELISSKNKEQEQVIDAGDFNLNNLDTVEKMEESDMLHTIDITRSEADTTPAHQIIKAHNIGFKNNGNTCYLNASLQALLGLTMVVTDILNYRPMVNMLESREGLVRSFWKLCLACTKGDELQANLEMKEIKRVMELLDKQFEGSQMQDASEFLGRFIDELSEDLSNLKLEVRKGKMDISNTHQDNLAKLNFRHEREEFHVCSDCNAQSGARHSDMAFWCDIVSHTVNSRTRSVSLQKLLEQNFTKEKRERRCKECGCETSTTTSKLVSLPKVIIINLKRYKYNNQDFAMGGKVSRVIDIPETVCLTSMVAETVSLPSTSLPTLLQDITTLPQPTSREAVHFSSLIPAKFTGLTQAQLAQLSEEDQLEYLLHVSQKEALSIGESGDDQEDKDIIAALDASMKEETFKQIMSMTDAGFKQSQDSFPDKVDTSGDRVKRDMIRTAAKKRTFGQVGLVGDESFDNHSIDNDMVNKNIMWRPREGRTEEGGTYSRALRENVLDDYQDSKPRQPRTKDEEEADLKEALKLSMQEDFVKIQEDINLNKFQWAMEDIENNNHNDELNILSQGQPEHCYKLASVVSHHGVGARSGHYVADVFRFDVPGWFRYDDTRVTSTDSTSVRTGTNTSNGYIFTYLYQPLWEAQCRRQ